MRRFLVPVVVLALLGAVQLFIASRRHARTEAEPANAVRALADRAAVEPSPAPGTPAGAALDEMKRAIERQPAVAIAKPLALSSPERRPNEPEPIFRDRLRALDDYRRFVDVAHVPPDREQALRRAIADAQESWRRGLEAANRTQPVEPGAEMMDPVLSQLFIAVDQDYRRALKAALSPDEATIAQSMMPSLLLFLRSRAIESTSR